MLNKYGCNVIAAERLLLRLYRARFKLGHLENKKVASIVIRNISFSHLDP